MAVVDDDESLRESLPDLLRALGYDARAYASAEEFLESALVGTAGVLILDVSMPGMSGPELHRELLRRGIEIPTIFITAHADDAVSPGLRERGVLCCLFKPFGEEALLDALRAALRKPP